ncbi:MAG: HAMP domain-containing histidine kinase [Polyangiaceae bacterium]|nr:HAMP domain-containing histidine kinase [Polyangiaceae bacterium]
MTAAPLPSPLSLPSSNSEALKSGEFSLREKSPAFFELSWLVRLRWIAALTQAFALIVFLALFALPISAMSVGIVAVGATVSNVVLSLWFRTKPRVTPRHLSAILIFDTVLLTFLLLVSGGPTNPLSAFYIVQIALAALLLEGIWALGLSVFSSLAFGSLFIFTPERDMHAMHHGAGFNAHLRGMWVSYTLVAFVVAVFVARVVRALRERDQEITALRERANRNERLASLSTLAAGAAHELGSPLGTIAIVAGELKLISKGDVDIEQIQRDADLLRTEAERCRTILRKMAGSAGAAIAEGREKISTARIHELIAQDFPESRLKSLTVKLEASEMILPVGPVVQSLHNLLSNAFDATEAVSVPPKVVLTMRQSDAHDIFVIEDNGAGITEDQRVRVGEPFFTTKDPGKGMGLGVYLARSLVERLGGDLRFENGQNGTGTKVTLQLARKSEAPR